ncbi:hypothetical protein PRIPAC_88084 [Pristionchus pacificus]|uniref:Uncharacterized protein n=1 Tax=Pristionchus pacificus TaxID=54126 RepID=A0A2A6B3Y5_PRIPA|nr:hypothetical protein PRIPAC_88084 [Pristionchus pacificus]|eukprot:PDM60571.1 hypothetical protein PRIPAC_53549 [Pristionchus pacificus]
MSRALLFVFVAIALLAVACAQSTDEIRTLCEKAACGNDECRIYGVNLDFAAACFPRPTMRFLF